LPELDARFSPDNNAAWNAVANALVTSIIFICEYELILFPVGLLIA
jgi:hypothetical protein